MILLRDTREQLPLTFPVVEGVMVQTATLTVGDYSALHAEGADTTIFERKNLDDLYTSFTGERYEAERAKIQLAKTLNLHYILAIEAPFSEVLKGHGHWAEGEWHEAKKSGLAMVRQLMTIQRKYGIQVVYCDSRRMMALYILEYYLAQERVKED